MADAHSFDEFYRGTRQRVLACLYGITGDLAEAQDAAQEAYARAWERWDKVGGYDDPEGWVRGVGWRVAVNRWRKARNRLTAHRRHGPEPEQRGPSEDSVALVAALKKIPAEQRRAIVLHHLGGLSVAEVAEETGVPVGTVKARLSRGRTALSGLLANEVGEREHV